MFDFQSLEQLSALTKNSEELQKKGVGFSKMGSELYSAQNKADVLDVPEIERCVPPAQFTPPFFLNLY